MKTRNTNAGNRQLVLAPLAVLVMWTVMTGSAAAQQANRSNANQPQVPAIGYASPRMTYYSGPTYGPISPFNYGYGPGYGYGRGQGGNVTYYQRGRNAFYIQSWQGPNQQYNVNTGFMRVSP